MQVGTKIRSFILMPKFNSSMLLEFA